MWSPPHYWFTNNFWGCSMSNLVAFSCLLSGIFRIRSQFERQVYRKSVSEIVLVRFDNRTDPIRLVNKQCSWQHTTNWCYRFWEMWIWPFTRTWRYRLWDSPNLITRCSDDRPTTKQDKQAYSHGRHIIRRFCAWNVSSMIPWYIIMSMPVNEFVSLIMLTKRSFFIHELYPSFRYGDLQYQVFCE